MTAYMGADALSSPKEKRLEDYKKPDFLIHNVNLTFQLFDDFTVVTARLKITKDNLAATQLVLDGGEAIELLQVSMGGQPVQTSEYRVDKESLTLDVAQSEFELVIETKIDPSKNTRLEGLYLSGGNYCTQCEAEGFRHITYFLDRPDVMARYFVRIEADKKACPVLLSNGNYIKNGELEGGRHFAEWDDPFPKPSYLFALVAGDLGCVSDTYKTIEGRDVALNIYVRQDDMDKCDYAMQSLKRSMKWDEDEYGLAYDLDIYNIVAVSDFNMGAMENKGLNVFNTKYVLASSDTATDQDFDHIEGVIGHEYFHNWTGNRVTCRDWFQLSLKEGLTVFRDQEFSSDMTSRSIKRIDDVRALRAGQFPEDAGPLAHPVRPESYIEINNFYTATIYNKGAEVIRMMHCLIGKDAFKAGMTLYFERHDGQAVTCEDFVSAMEAASDVDLTQFRHWYSQSGTPIVTASRQYNEQTSQLTLTVSQQTAPTPDQATKVAQHMPIAFGLFDRQGNALKSNLGSMVELKEDSQNFIFENVPKGTIVSLLQGFSAPINLVTDLTSEDLITILAHECDAFSRWEAAQTLAKQEILRLVGTVSSGNSLEVDPIIVVAFSGLLSSMNDDPALCAELLELPSENTIADMMDVINVDAIHSARNAVIKAIAVDMGAKAIASYKQAHDAELASTIKQVEKAWRRLKNMLLTYVSAQQTAEAEMLITSQATSPNNMTDSLAAMKMVLANNYGVKDNLLQAFHDRWIDDDLVMDKWFAMQASVQVAGQLNHVISLIDHPEFKLENPNRMRSLVMMFAAANPINFHHISGQGYDFLADIIIKLNKINPQVAARLLSPLGRWKKFEVARQQLMQNALKKILKQPSLSPDVFELANKLLTS